jgi:potassium-transporting ATPase KdpC subunit
MQDFMIALRSLFSLICLTGVIYPLLITGLSQLTGAQAAQGSLLKRGNTAVGSVWLAQDFKSQAYFWPRPSASDYATVASAASNQGPTNKELQHTILERKRALLKAHHLPEGTPVPAELLMASGSGLDPHLSPEAISFQLKRVSLARQTSQQTLQALINTLVEPPQFGVLGAPRINVLKLNLALDQAYPLSANAADSQLSPPK